MPLRQDMLLHEDQGHHWQGVLANINGERFVDAMLDACTGRGPHVRHIKDVADLMGRHRWSITAGLHAGGLGGGGRAPDPNPHITLSIEGQRTQFHVHYRTHGGFLITGITP
jgi:hypothetical protein